SFPLAGLRHAAYASIIVAVVRLTWEDHMKAADVLAITAAVLLAGQALTSAASAQTTFLIGNSTVGDAQAEANEKLAELVTKYTNGKLKGSARHGQSLGGYAQMIPALQAGSIGALVFPTGFMATIVPELSLFDMPFLTPGAPAQITAFARQSKAAEEMKKLAARRGILIMGFHGIGPQSFLTKFPVKTLEDIKGKKIRIIPSPPRVGAYQDWGAVPRPMELGEVYTSLQQGTLDGMENPPDVIYRMKHHEVAKYYTITEHFSFMSAVVVSKRLFDSQPKDIQAAITRASNETLAYADPLYTASQNDSLKELAKTITITKFPAAELAKMKQLAQKGVWARMEADPKRGPLVKLLKEDAARYAASAK
ncbi:MAG: TRAP transporter substrate-binding protein, partial [Hyphomicrobiaceae bacterium]